MRITRTLLGGGNFEYPHVAYIEEEKKVEYIKEKKEEPILPQEPQHLFEIWANKACTERPQVGQKYYQFYLKVNADLVESEYIYEGLEVWQEDGIQGVQYLQEFTNVQSVIIRKGSVIELGYEGQMNNDYLIFVEDYPISFGDIVE